jgi:serine phosphatase RsbU (regulator of sigma subunit)
LIPVLLFSLYIYAELVLDTLYEVPAWRQASLRGLGMIDRFPIGPFSVSLNEIAGILSIISLTVIMIMRSTRTSRQQAKMEAEIAAAREVQQVILPESSATFPGFKVESVYEPAQQVGGDFFQILPVGEGGLLVVVGDVSGKGLPAAMLVSVLVGSIRTAAEDTTAPEVLLGRLNERLIGRMRGGFSTALAALIAADGQVSVSNAGHLSPYLDGTEVELPGALPLGISSGARYEAAHFHLAPGSRLTFYSDGIVEAQNAQGEMFGFERSGEISMQPAAAIVKAAKDFGQQDDMTVVAITRDAAVASAA